MNVSESVRACEAEWIRVYLAQDADAFAALLDERFVYSSERGVFRKDEYVGNLASGEIEMRAFENESLEVIAHGGVLAVSVGVARLEATFRGQDISGRDRFTRVWVRPAVSAAWRAVALHANTLP